MKATLRTFAWAGVLAIGSVLGLGTTSAQAQGYGYRGYSGGGYGGGSYYTSGYSGPSYGVPSSSYYGNGGHDLQPHMHTVQTPIGGYSYYGVGRHDLRPHAHVQTPYGITGYSNGLFRSTQSYSPPAPSIYQPW